MFSYQYTLIKVICINLVLANIQRFLLSYPNGRFNLLAGRYIG